MKVRILVLSLGLLPLAPAHAQEGTVIKPQIDSVAMFKNGLTVVKASFEAGKPGDYLWNDPPSAVHGAFFVESGPGLVIRSTTRMMDPEGPQMPTGNLQQDLAGAIVRVSLEGGQGKLAEEITGKVWTVPTPERGAWNRSYATTEGRRFSSHYSPSIPNVAGAGQWLIVESGGQRRFLSTPRISQLKVANEAPQRVKVPRPVLVFSAAQGGKIELTYLTKGMAWMPAYQVDLLAGDRMRLKQTAVVRNELRDFTKTKMELISGYPNIKFAHVSTPLSPGASLTAFFQQISQEGGASRGAAWQQLAVTQNTVSNVAFNPVAPGAPNLPDGGTAAEDLHYESIGEHDLLEGDSLSVQVATAETSCERIVEWNVPDFRDERGRLRRRDRKEEEEPWDAVQFSNPLKFPMTTAAASVLEDGRFLGQSMGTWTAPGQKASIRINKALTVRGEHAEVEEEGKREIVWVAGDDYQRTVVSGRLKVSNARATPVKMVIRTAFSGELLEAAEDPVKTLKADGARSVNPHRQLEWAIDLGAGKSQTLTYRYSLLVKR